MIVIVDAFLETITKIIKVKDSDGDGATKINKINNKNKKTGMTNWLLYYN